MEEPSTVDPWDLARDIYRATHHGPPTIDGITVHSIDELTAALWPNGTPYHDQTYVGVPTTQNNFVGLPITLDPHLPAGTVAVTYQGDIIQLLRLDT